MIFDIKKIDWEEEKFSIPHGDHETYFWILRLQPMEAYRVLEVIRPTLLQFYAALMSAMGGGDTDDVDGDSVIDMDDSRIAEAESMAKFFQELSGLLDSPTLERVRKALFAKIRWRKNEKKKWRGLSGVEDEAFHHLDPLHVYEILVRSFLLNFTGTLRAFRSRFGLTLSSESIDIEI